MTKNTFASSLMAIIVFCALMPYHAVATAEGFDWVTFSAAEAAVQGSENQVDQNDQSQSAATQKKGNGFARALGAPFRALGRLFGGGDKKNAQSASRRISDKEAAKFESAKITRVTDARIELSDPASPTVSTNAGSDVHLQRGRELLTAGNVNDAITELTAAQAVEPKSAEIQNLLGVAYGSKGMNERALKAFEAAVRADKNNPQYLNNYGFILLQSGKFEAAAKQLKRASKLSPSDARIRNNLAIAQCQLGKFDEAYQSFVQAVGEFDGRVNMAAQLLSQGMGQEAIKHLEVAHALRPNSTEVLTRLAGLYNMTGRVSDAAIARKQLLALQTSAEAQK